MTPLPWSFSSLSRFNTCPKQYYHIKVARDVRENQNSATLWGGLVHEAIEKRLRDKTPLAPELQMYSEYCDRIAEIKGEIFVEKQLSINKDCVPCEWEAEDVWCRGIIDVMHIDGDIAKLIDHKTGKRKPDLKQLALFAILVFYHYPEVNTCKTAFMWLKTNEKDTAVYKRKDIPILWRLFTDDLNNYSFAFKKDLWIPRTSGLCHGWCPVKSCSFYEDKK